MGHNKPTPNSRANELTEMTSLLIGKKLAEVWYHDGIDEDGTAYFLEDVSPSRHELMQGVDLVTNDGITIGFFWDWNSKKGEFQLSTIRESVGIKLKDGRVRFNQSEESHWSSHIGNTITNLTFSAGLDDNYRIKIICDCRIDFDDADPIWICARQATDGCISNGDDTIVVFTEQEARRIGIKVNA